MLASPSLTLLVNPNDPDNAADPYATLGPLNRPSSPALSPPPQKSSIPAIRAELERHISLAAVSGSSCNQTDESSALATPEGPLICGEEPHWPSVDSASPPIHERRHAYQSEPSPRLVEGRKGMHRPPHIRRRSSSLDQPAIMFDSIYSIGEIHTASRLEAIPASTVQLGGSGISIAGKLVEDPATGQERGEKDPYLPGHKTRVRTYSTRPAPPPPHLRIEIPAPLARAEHFPHPHELPSHSQSATPVEKSSESDLDARIPQVALGSAPVEDEQPMPTPIPRRDSSLPTTEFVPLGPFTPPLERIVHGGSTSRKSSSSETTMEIHPADSSHVDTFEVRRVHRQTLVDIADDQVFHEALTALLTSNAGQQGPVVTHPPSPSGLARTSSRSSVTPIERRSAMSSSTFTDASLREQGIAAWFVTREIVQGERRYGRSLAKGLEVSPCFESVMM